MRKLLYAFLLFPALCAAQETETARPVNPYSCQAKHRLYGHRAPVSPSVAASNDRSDTVDVLNYSVVLNITDFTTNQISGYTDIRFTPRMNNVNVLSLDLLELIIDSIRYGSTPLAYSYNDTLLTVTLPVTHHIGDTSTIRVAYHGDPQGDASGWGGFYHQSGYAFNLGVGFAADPHVYGRVWFPCFDNFVERSTYDFAITTNSGRIAYCNGMLMNDTTDGNGLRTRTWRMNQPIPTYLASVAVSSYTHVNQVYPGMLGNIPVMLTALPADTTNMKNSFQHLDECLTGFEARFGPYRWDRIGFCLVPFSSGAMEHATNISYPKAAANGTLTYEADLMAHEFAHHWWGDLATCRTQEDMWLNEGWASYSEYIFTEWLYGHAAYLNSVRSNHEEMLHNVHITENGYRAVSGVPHAYTYSDHVYVKGADMAHTLRGYMGDSLFWPGLQYHLNQSIYKDVSSADFRDNLITATGLSYLNDFFNDWVFNGGWAQFSIDSFLVTPNSPNYDVVLHMKQKLDGAPNYYTNVPVEITFRDANWNTAVRRIMVSGASSTATVSIPFNPVYAAVDFDEKISDAVADEWRVISAPGTVNLNLARCTLNVLGITDSALVRVEHNFAPPDPIANNVNNYRISGYRYWNIDGLFPSNFYATGKFYYDGRANVGYIGNLDNALTVPNGDSIMLLYRRNAADDWHEYPHYTKTIVGPQSTSKYGYVVADSLQPGQYTFANGVSTVVIGVNEPQAANYSLNIFPNPADETITLSWDHAAGTDAAIAVYDLTGKCVHRQPCTGNSALVDISALPQGMYFAEVNCGDSKINQKFIRK